MLILSRKAEERVVIPAINTEIVVVEIKPDKVRLGFDAPHDIAIIRKEISEREQLVRETRHFWNRGEEIQVHWRGQTVTATIVELCRTHQGYPAYKHTQPDGKCHVTSQDALLNVASENQSE